MAEYYPLISRAVAGLRGGAPEARQAIYGRARQALIGQLRGMQPPVPEEAINKEIDALDQAVARIEAEIVAPPKPVAPEAVPPVPTSTPAADGPVPAPEKPTPIPPPVEPIAPPVAVPPVATPRPSAVRPPAPPVVAAGTGPARSERAVFERRSSLPPARPLPPRPSRTVAAAGSLAAEEVKGAGEAAPVAEPPSVTETSAQPPLEKPAETHGVEAGPAALREMPELPESPPPDEPPPEPMPFSLPVAPTLEAAERSRPPDDGASIAPTIRARRDELDDPAQPVPPVPDILAGEGRSRDEAIRPAMPRQTVRPPRDLRVWIVAVAALAAVVAIALTAWKLRDNPEELVRAPAPSKAEPATGKIVERADAPADEADSDAATPPPAAAATSAPPAAAAQPPAADQAIAVSYKAAILVSAPDTPEKVRTYIGTVVWRTESVAQGQDQPLGTAVRADIDVPDAKLQAVMELRKNTEAQFPASHTIDLKFTIGAGSPLGDVKQIDVPRLRSEDSPSGDPLVGVPVTITSNYFLVGLTRGAAEQRNMDAMRTRGWIDIPMILENGTPAKITFEKGASGDRILADALATWSRS